VYKYVAIKLILAQIKLTLIEFLSRKDKLWGETFQLQKDQVHFVECTIGFTFRGVINKHRSTKVILNTLLVFQFLP